jgi:uncharacterized membrane protein YkoI
VEWPQAGLKAMNREMLMDIKVIAFSVIALAGVAGLLAIGLGGAGKAGSDHEDEEEHEFSERAAVRSLAGPGDILSLEQILQNARQQHVGRVLEIELEEQRGSLVYEVEILGDSGEVWEMNFDARSGELLEEEREE